MIWTVQSFLSSFFLGTRTVYDKHLLNTKQLHAVEVAICLFLPVSLITAPIAFFLGEYNALGNIAFLYPMFANVIANALAFGVYIRIISKYDSSLFLGMRSIEPLFVAFTAFIFVGEHLSFLSLFGIAIVVIGCFMLQRSRDLEKIKKNLWHSPWLLSLLYISLTSTATTCSKLALLQGGVFAYLSSRYALLFFIYLCISFFLPKQKRSTDPWHWKNFGSGMLTSASVIFEMMALQTTKVAYVETIRRTSMFFAYIIESFLSPHPWNKRRLAAIAVLFLGIALVILSSVT